MKEQLNEWIDISMPLGDDMPIQPSSKGFAIGRNREFGPDVHSVSSYLQTDGHCGTHIDAPAHFFPDGDSIDTLDIGACMGTAHVVRVPDDVRVIDAAVLRSIVPEGAERVLLRTGVVAMEGVLLGHVEPGAYELVCLPIRLAGAEAAPARALLRPRLEPAR